MSESQNIKQKTASGILWTSIQKFTGMGISFIASIILARLLTPSDYGCIGMLTIFMVIAGAIVDGGFATALLQKKRPTREDYSTIFWWNLAVSLVMYFVLFVSAPMISRFYNMPILSSVLRVQGAVLVINTVMLIQITQLRKQFQFKKLALVTLVSSIIALTITIIMAYKGFGVWALVSLNLLNSLIPAVFYSIMDKWRPQLVFSQKSFKELFGFGFFIFIATLVNTFCNNIQGLLIGRFYNASTLGYYSKAKSTEEMASNSFSNVLSQVTFPLYSECQDDMEMLSNVIKRMTCTIAYITFPLMLLLILVAEPLFVLLYSDRWLDSVPYFKILCIAGIAMCLQSINAQAITAIGKSKVSLIWTIVKRIVGLVMVIGGLVICGIKGLLIGMVLQSWFIYLINASLVDKYIGYKLISQMKELAPIIGLAVISFCVSLGSTYVLPSWNKYIVALLESVIYVVIYYGGSHLFKMNSYYYFKDNVTMLIHKFTGR